jgi:hypothetical protein
MNRLTKTFVILAITCGASWLLKQVVIVASGGGDAENVFIASLWGLGMITFLLSAATGAALLLSRFAWWAQVLGAIVAIPVAWTVLMLADGVVDAVYEADGWFAQEIPLVLAALVVGGLGVRTLGNTRRA